MKCGLLGKKLGHSHSPRIHAMLGDYSYDLFEKEPEQLEGFIRSGYFHGLNVTIPYKKAAAEICSQLSPVAQRLGSVNTIVKMADGGIYGDNTDYFGFESALLFAGAEVSRRKCLVLGGGGAGVTAAAVLEDLGASQVVTVSREGEDNYENVKKHEDASIIVNATPVGMYPSNGLSPLDLTLFSGPELVLDMIYNPLRSALVMQAEELGIPALGGIHMLAAQAVRSSEIFTGRKHGDSVIGLIKRRIEKDVENIVLIGMPGSGKTTVAGIIAQRTGRKLLDTDKMIMEKSGMSISEIFAAQGEKGFRKLEKEVLAEAGKNSGCIISTGGGCVTAAENYKSLHQNGRIFWVERSPDKLSREDRPISLSRDLNELFAQRRPLYEAFCDCRADNNESAGNCADSIMEVMI